MATVAAVRKRALHLLGVTPVGQDAYDQDDTRIASAYTEVYNMLKDEGLATWAVAGTVPDKLVPYIAGLMALNANLDFGVSNDRYTRLIAQFGQNGLLAMREIRALTNPDYESLEEPDDY